MAFSSGGATHYDVAIVGAGFAGSAAAAILARAGASVLVVEQLDGHHDSAQGEWLAPWGVLELRALGLDAIFEDVDAWTVDKWVQWDESDGGDPAVWALNSFVEGVDGPLTFSLPRLCARLCADARTNGAEIVFSIRDLDIHSSEDSCTVEWGGGDCSESDVRRVTASHVLGAGGRAGPVGKLMNAGLEHHVHHWGAGLAVSGINGWPSDCQAVGTEGSVAFFVLPKGPDSARLYLSYPTSEKGRFAGPDRERRFLDAFNLSCLPAADALVGATPAGPLRCRPASGSTPQRIRVDNVVLIGDEAGATDPILGTGLSSALRDIRLVTQALMGGSLEGGLDTYVSERTERMRRLKIAADLQNLLMAEFGVEARRRRAEAWARIRQDDRLAALLLSNFVDPMRVPRFAFHPSLRERLVGRESCNELRALELSGTR